VATVAGHADMTFVDALMTKLPSFNVREGGRVLARMQNGVVQMYGAVMIVGLVGVMAWYWTPHSSIQAEFDGKSVALSTPPGLGYEYRWDANSDGDFETEWSGTPSTSFEYGDDDIRGVAVFIINSQSGATKRVEVGEKWVSLPLESVIPAEFISAQDSGFEVRVDGRDILFRKPFARTKGMGSKEVRLPMGSHGRLGSARVVGRPLVEATLEVRNAFGNARVTTKEIALPFDTESPAHASLTRPRDEVFR
jgi:NADH-quinone oxidoreductase subunit L